MSQRAPFLGFWEKLARPIIGLAPMDGITDVVCRTLFARHGKPHVMFTEFTPVEGLKFATERLLRDFEYTEIERPIVAQIYGHAPEDFAIATHMICELGFDGVDINMGCPAKNVVHRNCGGKLMTLPEHALAIIQATRQAIEAWVKGKQLEDYPVRPQLVREFRKVQRERRLVSPPPVERQAIPYSIKTRLGYDQVIIKTWIETLLQERPAVISIHGRTLKQMYRGTADWEAIALAVPMAHDSGTLILGNGDIQSLEEAHERIRQTGVDGVLVGRASIGNPWIFQGQAISLEARCRIVLEHAWLLETMRGVGFYKTIKKHLVRYFRELPQATWLRDQAVKTQNAQELAALLSYYQTTQAPIHLREFT